MSNQLNPFNEQQQDLIARLSVGLNRDQLNWINGYFQGILASLGTNLKADTEGKGSTSANLKILYGTHTGRSKTLAQKLSEKLNNQGINVQIVALDEYKTRQLTSETNLVFIVSTHGEGEAPAMAEDFYNFIISKRASKLPGLNYSVVALGDKSYKLFCKTGLDIDQSLSQLDAKPILPILKLDVDFEEEAEVWMNTFVQIFKKKTRNSAPEIQSTLEKSSSVIKEYSRRNPFKATVLDKVKITGRDSDKEVYHIELSLEGSGITYEPGDSVGILANNPPELVDKIISQAGFTGTESVKIKNGEFSITEALTDHLEITVLNYEVIQKYHEKTMDSNLLAVMEDAEQLDRYLYGHDVLDLLEEFAYSFKPQELADILRIFPARLYSISSSQLAVGDEVHATVSAVRYLNKGRVRAGACSTYLADRIDVDSQVSVFIEKNPAFKLPENEETPVILVGAGTGVAPYRAFLQQREASNLKGKTWLFFGERRFHSDFLYQLEWQKLLKEGYLEKIDVAFSRDQDEKVYVQHRLLESKSEIFNWLKNGAIIYLCGDMKQMARDVQNTMLQIFETEGGMSQEKALEYLKTLKKEKRFQTDVY